MHADTSSPHQETANRNIGQRCAVLSRPLQMRNVTTPAVNSLAWWNSLNFSDHQVYTLFFERGRYFRKILSKQNTNRNKQNTGRKRIHPQLREKSPVPDDSLAIKCQTETIIAGEHKHAYIGNVRTAAKRGLRWKTRTRANFPSTLQNIPLIFNSSVSRRRIETAASRKVSLQNSAVLKLNFDGVFFKYCSSIRTVKKEITDD